jgi:tRNA-dihydrouridine synthase C
MQKTPVKLYLAPMEGVTDWIMRDTLTQIGGIDFCVTEFLRVTKVLHPNKVFLRHCPELLTGSRTRVGTPVYFQLLGGEPQAMAENAKRAAELGAAGIDLNFGCPAKTVNRHDGGAVLLKSPHRLYDVTKAVRESVPAATPVSGKIRLGFEDTSLCMENARALQEAGVSWITVHCRTKSQGYRPPAHWQWIPKISEAVSVPVIANGDIVSIESFQTCLKETGANQFMIGRASLMNPRIFRSIKALFEGGEDQSALRWGLVVSLIVPFFETCQIQVNEYFAVSRTKQWLKHLALNFSEAREIFNHVKIYHKPLEFRVALENAIVYIRGANEAKHDGSAHLQGKKNL